MVLCGVIRLRKARVLLGFSEANVFMAAIFLRTSEGMTVSRAVSPKVFGMRNNVPMVSCWNL